jgi:flagellar biosynthesis protein FlhF
MKQRKFRGTTSHAVLQQVRTELGADALIVSNRTTADGIEVIALPGDEMASLLRSASDDGRMPLRDKPAAESQVWKRMMTELLALRSTLEERFAQMASADALRRQPQRAGLMRDLLLGGYSAAVAREITRHLPDGCSAAQARQWLVRVVAKNLNCANPADDIIVRGGIYALIGPTGVGKTTTAAKLAARCAVRHGAGQVALLTTDNYRIGAQDQLRIYARILGIPVYPIGDQYDLGRVLESLRDRHLVLIDTIGMGQRDERVAEQALLLAQPEIHRILLLNAAAHAETLDETVTAYGGGAHDQPGNGLSGCIISKLDEAVRPGAALDVIIRHRLLLHFVSNGQRVPEDLHAADAGYLAHRSLSVKKPSPAFVLHDAVSALLLGHAGGVAHA